MAFTSSDEIGPHRCRRLSGVALVAGVALSLGCAGGRPGEVVGASSAALSRTVAASDDTFIGSGHPDNNSGASASIFTGVNGQSGVMRGLIRFAMPADLQGRATVTRVALTMTVQ